MSGDALNPPRYEVLQEGGSRYKVIAAPEEPKPCPICHGPGQRIARGNIPSADCCDGERACPWYRVMVPLDAWQAIPRPDDFALRQAVRKEAKELWWRAHHYFRKGVTAVMLRDYLLDVAARLKSALQDGNDDPE